MWSSKEISALLGPSTAIARPPAPASLVQMLNSAGEERIRCVSTPSPRISIRFGQRSQKTQQQHSTWLSRLRRVQAGASCSDLGGAALAERPHGELEGAAHHVLFIRFHTHPVHAHLGGHKAHTVGVVADGNKLGGTDASRGGLDLGSDVLQVDICREFYSCLVKIKPPEQRRRFSSFTLLHDSVCSPLSSEAFVINGILISGAERQEEPQRSPVTGLPAQRGWGSNQQRRKRSPSKPEERAGGGVRKTRSEGSSWRKEEEEEKEGKKQGEDKCMLVGGCRTKER